MKDNAVSVDVVPVAGLFADSLARTSLFRRPLVQSNWHHSTDSRSRLWRAPDRHEDLRHAGRSQDALARAELLRPAAHPARLAPDACVRLRLLRLRRGLAGENQR